MTETSPAGEVWQAHIDAERADEERMARDVEEYYAGVVAPLPIGVRAAAASPAAPAAPGALGV